MTKNDYPILLIADKLQIDGVSAKHSQEEQFEALAFYLNHLIQSDFNRLLSILYRIDVSEDKVKSALALDAGKQSSGHTIARLLIEREMEKIKLRAKYSKK
ncbi:hypothetical protein [Elizabethkingia anophelis]|uniref:hypothetical protein n=1 Tax=Elizabethkingia anophelis TaxID=1117645 RepID=UPI0012B38E5D|nr:hypothetical protein [Elizabethkingia anophelis]QGN24261.1 hypothetical protein GJV56_16935 [Elizabethkingia anophelis]QNV10902.1 hypothetical protein EIY88_16905 [Elizabethkingia anophelis]UTF89056.1 hypothetical protein J2N93_17015 [Elizabethkingia anophelis]UTF99978.1 hypothetical protein J2O04_17230 [Elizabethkingia anophelis]UTG03693.1 hypothetical protein J2O03_17010 [Elizabethkingia anophelis]